MVLQKHPHMRLLLQYTLFGQLLLIEFLNLGNHVLNFLVYLQKIGIQDTFFSFYRREFIELWKWVFGVVFFLIANLLHIEVGLAEENQWKFSGITTNNTTDSNRVSHGIDTPPIPKRKATIGANATNMIKSIGSKLVLNTRPLSFGDTMNTVPTFWIIPLVMWAFIPMRLDNGKRR